jgi:hypothetical protein
MSETSQAETFAERVDVTTQPDGAFIGTLEIDVRHGDHQQDRIAALQGENTALRAEVLTLRNRVRELEAVLSGLD